MSIWDENKLMLFIGFVIPGFIALKLYELMFPLFSKDASKQIVDAVAYSCINYALLLAPIALIENSPLHSENLFWYLAFYVFVVFGAPIVWVLIWRWLRSRSWLQKLLPHPIQKPWDYYFGKLESCFVVVTFNDGSMVGGIYGTDSFASSAPAEEQIYLEESWIINERGGFDRRANQTRGILILGNEVSTIKFYNNGEDNDGEKTNPPALPGRKEGVSAQQTTL